MKLLIASQNAGKIAEMKPFLEKAGFDVYDAREFQLPEPEETGKTFIANARIKAEAALEATHGTMAVLADDSGIIIDALGDFPGVDSKPHMEACGSYPQAIAAMFKRLDGRPSDCHYATVLVLLYPDGREVIGEGKLHGRLISEPRGASGFGHDPWFELTTEPRTVAELSVEEKNAISHRGRAMHDLLQKLQTV